MCGSARSLISTPQKSLKISWKMRMRPNVRISACVGWRLRNGRMSAISSPAPIAARMSGERKSDPPAPGYLNDGQPHIEAGDVQGTMRHVEDAKDTKDQRQAERKQQHVGGLRHGIQHECGDQHRIGPQEASSRTGMIHGRMVQIGDRTQMFFTYW